MNYSQVDYNRAKFYIRSDSLNQVKPKEYMKVCSIVNGKGFFHAFKNF